MARISVQVPRALQAALEDLAQRDGKQLQPMLREILQAVVDGDDQGRVVSPGTREAIDSLREEQRRGEAALLEGLMGTIESLQQALDRSRESDRAEREFLTAAFKELQYRVEGVLERQTPPAPDEARQGPRIPFFGGGGER